jgi:streptomycin 6-kinase
VIPARLTARCERSDEASRWLVGLPSVNRELQTRWSLTIDAPFDTEEVSCAWVAPVTIAETSRAVLKMGMPHFEAEHEIAGLRFWDGNPTVRLLADDESLGAMLLERCEPGGHLRVLRSEDQQDVVVTSILRRLWRTPTGLHPFRPLSAMMARWSEETLGHRRKWCDAALVNEGLRVLHQLSQPANDDALLATDLHAGNILQATREPWLVIDPKPFIGDRAFDVTQHLLNCIGRLRAEPLGTIRRLADLLEVDCERVRLWTFGRLAAEPRDHWGADGVTKLAHILAP